MLLRGQLECSAAQVGSCAGISRPQYVGCLQQRGDGNLVTGLGTVGQLQRDLDGEGAGGQKNCGGLAVGGAADRKRNAPPTGLEAQLLDERGVPLPVRDELV